MPVLWLFGVLPGALDGREMFVLREVANLFPILFAHVGVDFDGSGVKAVATAFFAARDPVVLARFPVEVVGLEACAGKGMEAAALIVERFAGFGEGDKPDAGGAADDVAFPFNIHDSRFEFHLSTFG